MNANLTHLGYTTALEKQRLSQGLEDFEMGRIAAEHKERYIVRTENGEIEAEITGNLRFSAKSRKDFPAVGDWVALITYDTGLALIHAILPRFSMLSRQAVGHYGEVQIIAANIDYAFILQAVDRDFNINRLERYLTICHAARVNPIIVLTKTDLIGQEQLVGVTERIDQRIKDIPLLAISNQTGAGYEKLQQLIEAGKTYCMLGSSGVGKSSLVNNLSGKVLMKTGETSEYSDRGKHITSHRELIVLASGGILIDNPGMREIGIVDTEGGLEATFDYIISLADDCKYKDCTHVHEAGCAVIRAVETGELDEKAYSNYLKMQREKVHFETSLAEKRQKEKDFGKMMKNYKKRYGRK